MNEASDAIARWLERKRRTDQASAAVISSIALGSGTAVLFLVTLLMYLLLSVIFAGYFHSVRWLALVAFGLTAGLFARTMKRRQHAVDLVLDPMGLWIIKDLWSIGPRLLLEGLRQVRRYGQLGELNVGACARALTYLAGLNRAVPWEDLMRHCPQVASAALREQLSLLNGVLFLGEAASRITLMDPFRVRLRWMLDREQKTARAQEPAQPRPEAPPEAVPLNDPEKLNAYEILGVSPSASAAQIKMAYRKRIKECRPDLFAGMDQQAKALAERWTKALNSAYATLNPRHRGAEPNTARQR